MVAPLSSVTEASLTPRSATHTYTHPFNLYLRGMCEPVSQSMSVLGSELTSCVSGLQVELFPLMFWTPEPASLPQS